MSSFINYNFFNPKLKLLSDRYDIIREEYLSNKDKLEFKDFTFNQNQHIKNFHKGYPITVENYFLSENKGKSKGWHMAAILYDRYLYSKNADHMPILIETLKEIQTLTVCGINILDSGIVLDWHNDDQYLVGVDTLRVLWGLDVPVEENKSSIIQLRDAISGEVETQQILNNQFYCFYPSTEHRVENTLSEPRSVLAIDLLINP